MLKSTYVESLSLMFGRKDAWLRDVILAPMNSVPGGISHVVPETEQNHHVINIETV